MTTILAVHAHPDDVETLAAGTLAILARLGHAITIATLTAGECGSVEDDAAETARIRRREAATAAAMIGAAYDCVGLPDLGVFNDDASRRAVTELLRRKGPEIVITSAPADYHPDHEATSLLVRDACFAASAPGYRTGEASPLPGIPHLYFMDPIGARDRDGVPARPDFGVDIGGVMETKRRMLSAHQSQKSWLLKQHGITDFTAGMEAQSARRGRDFGVAFAEGFRHYRHPPYPRDPLLQALLGAILTPA
ncbi:MAG: family carbohydrate esterase [Caulobacteraceae bacterium]|nr:family carbohydrate esterase [Caulobacteraceae bacterium]